MIYKYDINLTSYQKASTISRFDQQSKYIFASQQPDQKPKSYVPSSAGIHDVSMNISVEYDTLLPHRVVYWIHLLYVEPLFICSNTCI